MNLFWLFYIVYGYIRLLVFINISFMLRLYGFLFNKIVLYLRVVIKFFGRFDVWIIYLFIEMFIVFNLFLSIC